MNSEIERVYRPRENARKSYNIMSRWYDLFTSSEKRFTDIGTQMLDIQPNETALEIGCGTGHSLVQFASRGGQVIAMDISEGMINAARKRMQNKVWERNVEFCQADGVSIPFSDGQFDAVFLSFTLELFDTPDIPKVLSECHRALKPNGRVGVVALAKQETTAVRIYEWFHRLMPSFIDCRPIFLEAALKKSQFSIQESAHKTMWGLPVVVAVAQK